MNNQNQNHNQYNNQYNNQYHNQYHNQDHNQDHNQYQNYYFNNNLDYNISNLHNTMNQYISYNSNILNLLIDNNNIIHRFTRNIDYYYRNHLVNNMQSYYNQSYNQSYNQNYNYNQTYNDPDYNNQWYNYNQNTINNDNNNANDSDSDNVNQNENENEITSMTIPINLERGLNNENREYFRNLSQENISAIIENNIQRTTFNLVDNPNDTMCAICQDDFEYNTEVGVMTHCNHIFKYDSLITWIRQKHTCPKCRYNILTNTNMICYNDSMVNTDYSSLNHNSSFILTHRQFRELLVVMFSNNNITLIQ
jgi:hypothetical protein